MPSFLFIVVVVALAAGHKRKREVGLEKINEWRPKSPTAAHNSKSLGGQTQTSPGMVSTDLLLKPVKT